MFHVQQMLETKQEEIERLAERATMREDGLQCSENMLQTDTKAFLKFFTDIKTKTQNANKELDEARKKKNEKNNEFRSINESIQILTSNIMKNIESLEVYNGYKVFLDQVSQNVPMTQQEKEREEEYLAKRREKQEDQERKRRSQAEK